MAVRLTDQAAAFIANFQHEQGPLAPEMEKAIEECQNTATEPVSLAQVSALFEKTLPAGNAATEMKKSLDAAKECGARYHCDGTNGQFLSQILSLKITKQVNHAVNTNQATTYDPLDATFNMAPDADVMLLFNARNVDRHGRPLLMKIIAREGVDLDTYGLDRYRTVDGWQRDVVRVDKQADYVSVSDKNEEEFSFGDPLKQVSLDRRGNELSTSIMLARDNQQIDAYFYPKVVNNQYVPDLNQPYQQPRISTGDALDKQGVETFVDRLRLEVAAKDDTAAAQWLGASALGYDVAVGMRRGFIFEPNAEARVSLAGTSVSTEVAADDAHLLGSPSRSDNVKPNMSLSQFLQSSVTVRSGTKKSGQTDWQSKDLRVADLLFERAKTATIAGKPLSPLGDVQLTRADFAAAGLEVDKRPLAGDPDKNGQRLSVAIKDSFASCADAQALHGWRAVVGYKDENGQWVEVGRSHLGGCGGEHRFSFDIADAPAVHQKDCKLEVRVFNGDGVPAERVVVPFREVPWAANLGDHDHDHDHHHDKD